MGKFSKFFKTRIAPVVLSAVAVASPVFLTACDESSTNNTLNNTSNVQTGVSNTQTEGVEETPSTTLTQETLNQYLAKTYYAGNDDKVIHSQYEDLVKNAFQYFSISDLLNNTYYTNLKRVIATYLGVPQGDNSTWSTYVYVNQQQAGAINDLIDPNSTYAFNIYAYNETDGNSYQLIKDGPDTFGVVITKASGQVLYNGYFGGVAYTEGEGCFKGLNFPLLTNEYKNLISQAEVENSALLWGQNVLAFCFGASYTEDVMMFRSLKSYNDPLDATGFNKSVLNLGGVVTSYIQAFGYADQPKVSQMSPVESRIKYNLSGESVAGEKNPFSGMQREITAIEFVVNYSNYTIAEKEQIGTEPGFDIDESGNIIHITKPVYEDVVLEVDKTLYPEIVLVGLIPTSISEITLPD